MTWEAFFSVFESITWKGFWLPLLQVMLLVNDGVGVFASYTLMQYYKPPLVWSQPLARQTGIFLIFVYFIVRFSVFVMLTISDMLVIMGFPQFWATLPIVRGHIGRFPDVVVMLWMIRKQHAR